MVMPHSRSGMVYVQCADDAFTENRCITLAAARFVQFVDSMNH